MTDRFRRLGHYRRRRRPDPDAPAYLSSSIATRPPNRRSAIVRQAGVIAELLLPAMLALVVMLYDQRLGSLLLILAVAYAYFTLSVRAPVLAFQILLLTFFAIYERTAVFSTSLSTRMGGSTVGGVYLGDLLWVVFTAVCTWKWLPRLVSKPVSMSGNAWALTPYILLTILLPTLGVLIYQLPWNFVSPSIRALQWVSFAVLGYFLCRRHGSERVARALFIMVVIAGFCHLAQTLLQSGHKQGLLGREWLYLSDIGREGTTLAIDSGPRLTGLLSNPNSLGALAAIVMVVGGTLHLHRTVIPRWLATATLLAAAYMIFASGSRSALLGVLSAVLIVGAGTFLVTPGVRVSTAMRSGVLLAISVIGIAALIAFTPHRVERFVALSDALTEGSNADASFAGRVDNWSEYLRLWWYETPLGTLVAPAYTTGLPPDNYYVALFAQGGPIFVLAFLMFLATVLMLSRRVVMNARSSLQVAAGVTLAGWASLIVGTSVGSSSGLIQLVPLWALIGICHAMDRSTRGQRSLAGHVADLLHSAYLRSRRYESDGDRPSWLHRWRRRLGLGRSTARGPR